MLVMPGYKTISTNTRHWRAFLFLETFLIFQEEYQQWQKNSLRLNNELLVINLATVTG